MRGILRLGLLLLLVAAAGVGNVWGEWKDYTPVTPGAITWQYEEIDETTCKIKPKDKNAIGTTVDIPEDVNGLKVVEIAKEAFDGCSKLEAVDIPNSVKAIGKSAFRSCFGLKKVKFSTGLTTIGESAFLNCHLKAVDFPNGLTRIGGSAFNNCNNLTEVKFPSGVQTIGNGAFQDCDRLKEVSISSSVREIGDFAFSECKKLTEFKVEEKNASYSQVGGVLFRKDMDTLVSYPGKRTGDYKIPSSVKGIKAGAFYGCSGLTAVTIPGSVTKIGGRAFENCSSLTEVTIPGSVTAIVWGAFYGCSGLTKVTIPSSVTAIEWAAFYECRGLTEVTIPSSVTEIAEMAFQNCRRLKAIYWLADADCNVGDDAFLGIASSATLYVRQDERSAIRVNGKTWWNVVSQIVEGYEVTFQDGNGHTLGEQLVKPNGTAIEPTAPTKKGYTFVKWQLDGKKYDFSTPVTQDIKLVAVWKKNEESTPSTPKDPETAVESVQLAGVRVVRNPVGEALELEGMERAARVEVYSVVGAQVHAEALRGEPRVVIDAQGWASGVYVVRVVASDGERTLRVVK